MQGDRREGVLAGERQGHERLWWLAQTHQLTDGRREHDAHEHCAWQAQIHEDDDQQEAHDGEEHGRAAEVADAKRHRGHGEHVGA